MKHWIAIAVAGTLLSSAASAEDFARTGIYAGIAGTIGAYTSYSDELEKSLRSLGYLVREVEVESSIGVKAKLGYRFHPRFAAEAEYEFLPGVRLFINDVVFGEHETWAVGANGKVFALTGRFQPFALVGIGAAGATLRDVLGATPPFSATGFMARFGGGLDIYATDHVVLGVDVSYVLPTGDLDGLDYVSFGWGLQYRF